MYFTTKSLIAASGLVMVAQGHMIMRTPTPYTSPQANSSPLDPSGSDFPCKAGAGAQYAGTATPMEKGSKQTLSFTGSATHGGGSCQVSITYDNPPTKQSKWKVIHSIQGGCPARNTAGNLGNDPTMEAPDKYEFAIPQDIPSGNATLAWTWFNKVGNREMYMNCSPIDIVGSEGSEAALAGLPDMMVANIAGTDCTTKEGVDIKFPNPGSSVETNSGAALGSPTGNCGGPEHHP
ncbi:lytic polysaccharide monooxygenase [Canariomyces notabilis]|uniref:Lytic polysaccharide monooxygenase n=1 Tax=Canariomyces notabilis TaxID=2074819 RepID=A0AAN6QI19_9PEZI|nr:lytic polysaccharide monooxygenase [Canariomyces arenarius]